MSIPYSAVYQVENAVLAIRIVEYLLEKESKLTPENIQDAFQKRQWAGRMEQVLSDIYLDGAHNQGGVRAFVETARELTRDRKCVLLFGAVKEKNYQDMIKNIAADLPCSEIVVTNLNTPRSLGVKELAKTFSKNTTCTIVECQNVREAWEKALELKNREKILFCVGSLYLVGEIKAILGE